MSPESPVHFVLPVTESCASYVNACERLFLAGLTACYCTFKPGFDIDGDRFLVPATGG